MSTFDPAAHLHKQGWKGKGTALKQGHATRPLAVVQKKNLGGIGRDRDEAIPFWDQIFASTAASIFTPSPTPSGSSTPIPLNSAHTSTRSWTTTTFGAPTVQVKKAGTVSVAARVNKEQAKKGLYSRFFRGKVVEPDPEPEAEVEVEQVVESSTTNRTMDEEAEAGPSNSITDPTISIPSHDNVRKKDKGKGKDKERGREGETKEERRARRAEKAKRKQEREERKALKASTAPITDSQIDGEISGDKKGKTKRKRKDHPEVVEGANGTTSESRKVKVKKVADEGITGDEGLKEDVEIGDERKKEKRKKREKKAKKESKE